MAASQSYRKYMLGEVRQRDGSCDNVSIINTHDALSRVTILSLLHRCWQMKDLNMCVCVLNVQARRSSQSEAVALQAIRNAKGNHLCVDCEAPSEFSIFAPSCRFNRKETSPDMLHCLHRLNSSGGSTRIFYLCKSSNATENKYFNASKSHAFKRWVSASKYTESTKS